AAGHDAHAVAPPRRADDPAELARHGVEAVGLPPAPGLDLANARAAEHEDGMAHAVSAKLSLGLVVLELQAHAARLLVLQECRVAVGLEIACAGLRLDALLRSFPHPHPPFRPAILTGGRARACGRCARWKREATRRPPPRPGSR